MWPDRLNCLNCACACTSKLEAATDAGIGWPSMRTTASITTILPGATHVRRRRGFWSKELEERWRRLKYDHMDRQTGCYNCPKKCRNVINWPGRKRLRLQMLRKRHLPHGGLQGAGLHLRHPGRRPGVRTRLLLDTAGHGLRRRALRNRHLDG